MLGCRIQTQVNDSLLAPHPSHVLQRLEQTKLVGGPEADSNLTLYLAVGGKPSLNLRFSCPMLGQEEFHSSYRQTIVTRTESEVPRVRADHRTKSVCQRVKKDES